MANSIVFLATAWGVRHGGINSFNHDLTSSLASIASTGLSKIICVVPAASEDEKHDAENKGVTLLCLNHTSSVSDLPEERAFEFVEKLREHSPSWWIGHDVKTGPIALKAKEIDSIRGLPISAGGVFLNVGN